RFIHGRRGVAAESDRRRDSQVSEPILRRGRALLHLQPAGAQARSTRYSEAERALVWSARLHRTDAATRGSLVICAQFGLARAAAGKPRGTSLGERTLPRPAAGGEPRAARPLQRCV